MGDCIEYGCRSQFWRLARAAVARGLLTASEARIIARCGGRKNWAWGSHLARLRLILADRERVARNV
jgi:hypothetical protein